MQNSGDRKLQAMFKVAPASKSFRRAVPRRIEAIRPFKGITNYDANWMKTHAYDKFGLSEYDNCWTGEMNMRPIPFVSTDPRPLRTQSQFERYITHVLAYLLPDVKPAIQAINKISSLGYPISANPGDGLDKTTGIKRFQSKFDVMLSLFEPMQRGDFEIYADGYHTIGVRKQNESPSKKRVFQFIDSNGLIFEKEITAQQRAIQVPQLGEMIGSRSRTIVRPPVVNLWLQCWDTLIHDAIKKHPLCDANVYNRQEWPQDAYFVTFDCKHYERYLGLCAISYAHAIGGIYEQQLLQLIKYPFIVPSSDWTNFWEIRPVYGDGIFPQFSSGLSPVAPLGKLTNICVQVGFFVEEQHMDVKSAIATVLSGASPGLRRWSFGDDNRLEGDKDLIDEFCKYMGAFFDIEVDECPTYLGTVFRADLGRWCLPSRTYNLKLYQPERDYEWKDFPNLGMVARRATFVEFGEPEIASKIIPFEDELWLAVGHPFLEIAAAAVAERQASVRKGIHLTDMMVTNKEYLMTDEQKARSGLFWHLSPQVVATIVNSLVGDDIKSRLMFKDQPFTPIPLPDTDSQPYQSNPLLPESINYANEEAEATTDV
jgi:hypothetical protein